MNQTVVKQFFDAWAIYEEVLDRNYMFHNELFAAAGQALAQKFGSQPFSILDLGCGSALHISALLRGRDISGYVGYDLSDVALTHAGKNLAALNCPVEVRCADFFDGLNDELPAVDLIFSSYALHHLSTMDKETFFRRVLHRLKDTGALLLIDYVRDENETRDICVERYCEWIRADWTTLPKETHAPVFEHIQTHDFPESNSTMHRLAASAGFRNPVDVCQVRGHCAWLFMK